MAIGMAISMAISISIAISIAMYTFSCIAYRTSGFSFYGCGYYNKTVLSQPGCRHQAPSYPQEKPGPFDDPTNKKNSLPCNFPKKPKFPRM
jgi:hypothetical protein